MAGELVGNVALITGAGQGIGHALARGFAAAGATVVATDVLADNAARTAVEIEQQGGSALGLALDVSSREEVETVVDETVRRLGRIDILINNAGIFPRASIFELDDATWDAVLGVNLKGTFLCSQAVARAMVRQGGGGRIISLASRAAYQVAQRATHYAASKAGIIAFSRNLAVELGPYNITVNVIAPGLTDTAQPRYGMTEEEIAASADLVPLGRIAQPDDMVPIALFLCGPGGTYITGQVHHVNGGSYTP